MKDQESNSAVWPQDSLHWHVYTLPTGDLSHRTQWRLTLLCLLQEAATFYQRSRWFLLRKSWFSILPWKVPLSILQNALESLKGLHVVWPETHLTQDCIPAQPVWALLCTWSFPMMCPGDLKPSHILSPCQSPPGVHSLSPALGFERQWRKEVRRMAQCEMRGQQNEHEVLDKWGLPSFQV